MGRGDFRGRGRGGGGGGHRGGGGRGGPRGSPRGGGGFRGGGVDKFRGGGGGFRGGNRGGGGFRGGGDRGGFSPRGGPFRGRGGGDRPHRGGSSPFRGCGRGGNRMNDSRGSFNDSAGSQGNKFEMKKRHSEGQMQSNQGGAPQSGKKDKKMGKQNLSLTGAAAGGKKSFKEQKKMPADSDDSEGDDQESSGEEAAGAGENGAIESYDEDEEMGSDESEIEGSSGGGAPAPAKGSKIAQKQKGAAKPKAKQVANEAEDSDEDEEDEEGSEFEEDQSDDSGPDSAEADAAVRLLAEQAGKARQSLETSKGKKTPKSDKALKPQKKVQMAQKSDENSEDDDEEEEDEDEEVDSEEEDEESDGMVETQAKVKKPTGNDEAVISTAERTSARMFESDEDEEGDSDEEDSEEDEGDESMSSIDKSRFTLADSSVGTSVGQEDDSDEDESEEDDSDDDDEEEDSPKKASKSILKTPKDAKQTPKEASSKSAKKVKMTPATVSTPEIATRDKSGESKHQHVPTPHPSKGKEGTKSQLANGTETPPTKGTKRKLDVTGSSDSPATPADSKVLSEEATRKRERDVRTLFVRNLPRNFSDKDFKSFCPDILNIRKPKGPNASFAFIEFANEQTTERAYAQLQSKKCVDKELFVDFVGDKAKVNKSSPKKNDLPINPLELYVGGLPRGVTPKHLETVFPASTQITLPSANKGKRAGFAFVHFGSVQDARAAFDQSRALKIQGVDVQVLYARAKNAKSATATPQSAAKQKGTDKSPAPKKALAANAKKQQVKAPAAESDDSEEGDSDDEELSELTDESDEGASPAVALAPGKPQKVTGQPSAKKPKVVQNAAAADDDEEDESDDDEGEMEDESDGDDDDELD